MIPLRAIACLLFLAATSSGVAAQAITQVAFLPQTFYIGDVVEARVVVRSGAELAVTAPASVDTPAWIDIRNVAIVPRGDGFEVRIVFQPFFVGTRQLPPIDLGEYELAGIGVYVAPIAGDAGEMQLQPVRAQLILPGTRVLIAVLIAMVVGIPTTIVIAGGWLQKWSRHIVRRYRESRPYRRAARRMRALQQEMMTLDGRRYYIALLDLVREYYDGRFSAGMLAATTGEMDHRLRRVGVPDESRDRLVDLFRFGDLVKFARRKVTVAERTEHLELVRSVIRESQRLRGEGRADVGA